MTKNYNNKFTTPPHKLNNLSLRALAKQSITKNGKTINPNGLPRSLSFARNDANAFTLAETLITLVIVGVVAALTVPTLIAKYQEQQTVTAVKKFYSEISQAYNSAIAKNGPPETWSIMNTSKWNGKSDSTRGLAAEKYMDIFSKHLRIMNRCGNGGKTDTCFGKGTYKALNSKINWNINPSTGSAYSTARLDNGFLIWLQPQSDFCSVAFGTSNKLKKVCLAIGVDINGYKKPNALGKDTFYFWITKYGIVPFGTREDSEYNLSSYCKLSSTNTKNGYACAAWIIEKGNMDYLHRDVSW